MVVEGSRAVAATLAFLSTEICSHQSSVPQPPQPPQPPHWGTPEEYGDARLEPCRAFLPVPGVMQTVQRAEFLGTILAMQAYWPCHLGIDNLHVARSLLDHDRLVRPLPLVKDGDLIALVQYMIHTRGRETVRVTEVERYLGTYPVDFSGPGMLMIFPWKSLSTLMFGLMLAGRISPL